ncbi:C-C motif chemokine 20-like [Alosa pseudoharengus]|uniref:C-C motif chemokine 20-like n=1 Tax=Alosa pseudoharengus TaxID=34774 RepID=UPI003F8B54DE
MAASGDVRLLCWTVVFLSLCYMVRGGDQAVDCCLRVSENKIPLKILASYWTQSKDQGCNINAVVFITEKGRQLCAPPHAHWVRRRMAKLDARVKCREDNFMGDECKGRN